MISPNIIDVKICFPSDVYCTFKVHSLQSANTGNRYLKHKTTIVVKKHYVTRISRITIFRVHSITQSYRKDTVKLRCFTNECILFCTTRRAPTSNRICAREQLRARARTDRHVCISVLSFSFTSHARTRRLTHQTTKHNG